MKATISQKAFSDALVATSSVVAARTPKPILQCVHLQAASKVIHLCATDQEVGIRFEVPEVEIETEGQVVVPADKLLQIVRETADETLSLELAENVFHIRSSDSHFQVYSQDPADFPPVPSFEHEPQFEIEGALIHRLIERTLYAAAKENTRYAINGVLWEKQGKQLRLVATDGRRLALMKGTLASSSEEDMEVIVSTKAMSILLRVVGQLEDRLGVCVTNNQVLFRAGRATISAVLVEGHFPKYEDVIPKDVDKNVDCSTEELLSAVRRSALLTNEESKGVRLSLQENSLVLSSRAPQEGEAQITMTVAYEGPALEIGFNPNFLVEALRVVDCEQVRLALHESNRPGMLKTGDDFLYVVMPVSLS